VCFRVGGAGRNPRGLRTRGGATTSRAKILRGKGVWEGNLLVMALGERGARGGRVSARGKKKRASAGGNMAEGN